MPLSRNRAKENRDNNSLKNIKNKDVQIELLRYFWL